jgi:DNA repair exonuclease SbcCD nuclease subunit
MNLMNKLNEASSNSRLNAIDAAYYGNPYAGSNFKTRWQGYNDDGMAVVKYQDKNHAGRNISGRSARLNKEVTLRVSKGQKIINY